MPDKPTLYVCHGDTKSPRFHPCGKVQMAMNDAGVEYDKVIAAKGNPIPFLRGPRDKVRELTGQDSLPALKLADGTVITPHKAILDWVEQQRSATPAS
jgi:hypothetical protein